jgi:type IV secretory pathway VirB4 component
VAKRPEALLGDKIPLEDHIADDVVLTRGNGVLAMFSADGVSPDTADDTDIAAWFDRLHNALKNIAAEDVELTVYQCRGEAEPSGYEAGRHRVPFARELDAAYRTSLFRGLLYSNRLFLAVQVHAPPAAAQSGGRFLAETGKDPRSGKRASAPHLTRQPWDAFPDPPDPGMSFPIRRRRDPPNPFVRPYPLALILLSTLSRGK